MLQSIQESIDQSRHALCARPHCTNFFVSSERYLLVNSKQHTSAHHPPRAVPSTTLPRARGCAAARALQPTSGVVSGCTAECVTVPAHMLGDFTHQGGRERRSFCARCAREDPCVCACSIACGCSAANIQGTVDVAVAAADGVLMPLCCNA